MKKMIIMIILSVLILTAIPTLAKAGTDGETSCEKGYSLVCVSVDDQGGEAILINEKGKIYSVCPAQAEQAVKLACKSKDEVKAAEKAAKARMAKAKKKAEPKPAEPSPASPASEKKVKDAVEAAIVPLKGGETMEAGEAKVEVEVKCAEGKGKSCDLEGTLDELQKQLKELVKAANPAPGKTAPEKTTWCGRHPGKCAAIWTMVGTFLTSVVGVTICAASGCFGDVNVVQ